MSVKKNPGIRLNLSADDERFLALFKMAAKLDCLYIFEFHCQALFGHTRITGLTLSQQSDLEYEARRDIFVQALAQGYVPEERHDEHFCRKS